MNSSTAGNLYALEKRAVKFGKVTDVRTAPLSLGEAYTTVRECKLILSSEARLPSSLCLSLPAHLEWRQVPDAVTTT
jgi:hypothetical protein